MQDASTEHFVFQKFKIDIHQCGKHLFSVLYDCDCMNNGNTAFDTVIVPLILVKSNCEISYLSRHSYLL